MIPTNRHAKPVLEHHITTLTLFTKVFNNWFSLISATCSLLRWLRPEIRRLVSVAWMANASRRDRNNWFKETPSSPLTSSTTTFGTLLMRSSGFNSVRWRRVVTKSATNNANSVDIGLWTTWNSKYFRKYCKRSNFQISKFLRSEFMHNSKKFDNFERQDTVPELLHISNFCEDS